VKSKGVSQERNSRERGDRQRGREEGVVSIPVEGGKRQGGGAKGRFHEEGGDQQTNLQREGGEGSSMTARKQEEQQNF